MEPIKQQLLHGFAIFSMFLPPPLSIPCGSEAFCQELGGVSPGQGSHLIEIRLFLKVKRYVLRGSDL